MLHSIFYLFYKEKTRRPYFFHVDLVHLLSFLLVTTFGTVFDNDYLQFKVYSTIVSSTKVCLLLMEGVSIDFFYI